MKGFKKIVLMLLVLAMFAVTCMVGCVDNDGKKTVSLTVVHGDKTTKEFVVETTEEFLDKAFESENIFIGDVGEWGLFITAIDGEAADSSKEEWWCLTKMVDGKEESVMTGVSSTPVSDGDRYVFTFTVGW